MSMNTNATATPTTTAPRLPATLELGPVHLTVTDVDRSVGWYQRALGLRVHRHDADVAELGDSQATILVLHEDAQARPPGRHDAGLYHYALLYPTREELARAALRLAATQTPIQGASDHVTHEAIYLPDPDGNGIELAADRPRADWPADLGYAGGPAPLDFDSLLATVEGPPPAHIADGLGVGHLHLHVGDIDEGLAFYRDILGFELRANLGSAAFVSAGGYHHHLGFNVWRGRGAGAPAAHTVGLDRWTVELPTGAQVAEVRARADAAGVEITPREAGFSVRDPWGSVVAFVAGS
jgi:catechol 2,3-dioxygenase